jgi:hypothetical protein
MIKRKQPLLSLSSSSLFVTQSYTEHDNHNSNHKKNRSNQTYTIQQQDHHLHHHPTNNSDHIIRPILAWIPNVMLTNPTSPNDTHSVVVDNLLPNHPIHNRNNNNLNNNNHTKATTTTMYDTIKKWCETIFTTPAAASLEKKMTETIESNLIVKSTSSRVGGTTVMTKVHQRSGERRITNAMQRSLMEHQLVSTTSKSSKAAVTAAAVKAVATTTGSASSSMTHRVSTPSRHIAERILSNRRRLGEEIRVSEHTIQRVGEKLWFQITKKPQTIAKATRATQTLTKQTVYHLGVSVKTVVATKQMSLSLSERIMNQFRSFVLQPMKHGIQHSGVNHLVERTSERLIMHRHSPSPLRLFTPRSSRVMQRVVKPTVQRYGKHPKRFPFGPRIVLSAIESSSSSLSKQRTIQFLSTNLFLRLGHVCLIALPLMGGLFSVSLCYQDLHRVTLETNHPSIQILFSLAGIADFMDAIIHFILSYLLLFQQQYPHMMSMMDTMSSKCMIVSTVCVIVGEVMSTIRQQQHQQPQLQPPHSQEPHSQESNI